jgi:uncharacterized membrane protein/invasion protein IalB
MMAANRLLIALVIVLLWAPVLAGAAAAEVRHSGGAWTTVCRLGGGYCTASARVPAKLARSSYEYLLRISRGAPDAAPEIAILMAGPRPRSDATITVEVDHGAVLTLSPGTGYRVAASGGTYILDATMAAALLDAMKSGKQVEFRYVTLDLPAAVAFSLSGFAEALAFVERTQKSAIPAKRPEVAVTTEGIRAVEAQPANAAAEAAPVPLDAKATSDATAAPVTVPATAPIAASEPKPAPAAPRAAQSTPPGSGHRRVAKLIRQFTCRANEPFWNLSIDNGNARFVSLSEGGEPQAVLLAGKLGVTGEGRTPDVDWRGKSDTGASYRAFISEARCVESMTDKEGEAQYEYRIQLTMPNGKTLRGCCHAGLDNARAPQVPNANEIPVADLKNKAPDDWSRFLLDLLPAVEACLDKTPGPSAYVTKAWPMNRSMVGTRTRNRDGGWFECVASSDGSTVERIEMLPKASTPLPGEQLALFTPLAQAPPAGNCYRTERIQDAAGKLVGWLSGYGC